MNTSGDIMSTSGDIQYIGGYHDECGRCSVHRRDTMWGSNLIKSFQFLLKTPMY